MRVSTAPTTPKPLTASVSSTPRKRSCVLWLKVLTTPLKQALWHAFRGQKRRNLDPATGTGTYICEIIEYLNKADLEYKYANELHCNEVAILPYYIANLNIEYTYKQKMGVGLRYILDSEVKNNAGSGITDIVIALNKNNMEEPQPAMDKITQEMKYRYSLVNYALKYGVSKASRRYNRARSVFIYWFKRFDGA